MNSPMHRDAPTEQFSAVAQAPTRGPGWSLETRDFHHGDDPILQVRGLAKSFGSTQILKNINFEFQHNAITTVLGPSGTGKSVLIKHLVGLLAPDAGEVRVGGQDIWAMSENERYDMRTRFGVCWQDGALFGSMNLYDNVAFPLRKHTRKSEKEIEQIVMKALDEVGLGKAAHKAPNEVSGGMKKRAGFARALVMNPDIVLFDEPDSGLDPVRTSLLCDIIMDVHNQHGGTYLLVTHDIKTARKVSDYVGLIWKGEVVHYGPAQEAFEHQDPFVKQFLAGQSAGPLGMD
ncbi:ABC transporter ATP-binding protein [Pseudonocardia sp. RS11V-5]|uniref:ABC transporter ATP-binding protein n=1 Tax=Pseudonocardia terrae TaxID=2905831 RepID=UPI001E2B3227|nr:ABC transporter ATP-binding protein [Pseudonocardia terrae]MCE3552851.1 ABC transporter ATP-binding protein [Pseudonocardia terrae]